MSRGNLYLSRGDSLIRLQDVYEDVRMVFLLQLMTNREIAMTRTAIASVWNTLLPSIPPSPGSRCARITII